MKLSNKSQSPKSPSPSFDLLHRVQAKTKAIVSGGKESLQSSKEREKLIEEELKVKHFAVMGANPGIQDTPLFYRRKSITTEDSDDFFVSPQHILQNRLTPGKNEGIETDQTQPPAKIRPRVKSQLNIQHSVV